ncbi:MAG: isoprenoid biosynthesis glyoxalase ElbB [Candidatus Electryonea clarkiae]|nr:isoprenoid biosynthesis glyoxalase ElbB [Candidatus Electryonea clarkiae]MDP8286410.1 isoprenoid biosynthesis glyoxalase ElbB [Candidatus Electryonea clarkiae]
MPRVAVILSGSGVYDGSEIHESVLTLLHLANAGLEYECFAPDKDQFHVINHDAGQPAEDETRNVRVESARIARGPVAPLSEIKSSDFDALILPGGFGAAKNLCDYGLVGGPDITVDTDVENAVNGFYADGKPIAAMCIAPANIAKIFGDKGLKVKLTIGNDPTTAGHLEVMGAEHIDCPVDEIVVDEDYKIVTTPAYMLGPGVADINMGIKKLVDKVAEWIK